MDQALLSWKELYNIDDNAFTQLCNILATSAGGDLSFGPDVYTNYPSMAGLISDNTIPIGDSGVGGGTRQTNVIVDNPQYSGDLNEISQDQAITTSNQVTQRSRATPCILCWKKRKKCEPTSGGICKLCSRTSNIPQHICVRERYADQPIFSKWQDANYQSQLEWRYLSWISPTKRVVLSHHAQGPSLYTDCRQFEASSSTQTRLFWKDSTGWQYTETTPFALATHEVNMEGYVTASMEYFLSRGDYNLHLYDVFQAASSKKTDSLVLLALKLWAANRLLAKAWGLHGPDTLGMDRVTDKQCAFYNTVPAPRVLQNQLDRNLESYIAMTEYQFLDKLQYAMLRANRHQWIAIFIAVVLTLHTRERDIWRLEHWVLYPKGLYQWRHPETASALIKKSVHLSNLLLNHLYVAGEVPREFYFTGECVKNSQLGPAYTRYVWQDEESIDLSLSSLAFGQSLGQVKLAEFQDFGC